MIKNIRVARADLYHVSSTANLYIATVQLSGTKLPLVQAYDPTGVQFPVRVSFIKAIQVLHLHLDNNDLEYIDLVIVQADD